MRTCSALAPDSSPESYLLPTRPARRPEPYASDTLPGVTPPSVPRLIFVCIQPSPWARRSVGVVERDGSRFLWPWWGRRGSGTFSTSRECSPSVTPTPYPRPLRPLFQAALVAVAPLVLGPGRLPPWSGTWLLWCPCPCFSSSGNCRPGRPLLFTSRCPIICLQLDAFSISLNVPSPWLAHGLDQGPSSLLPAWYQFWSFRAAPPSLFQAGTEDRPISAGEGSSHPRSAWALPHPRLL